MSEKQFIALQQKLRDCELTENYIRNEIRAAVVLMQQDLNTHIDYTRNIQLQLQGQIELRGVPRGRRVMPLRLPDPFPEIAEAN